MRLPQPQSNKVQLGFTIVELMITLVIFGILTSIAFPSYRNFIANSQIRSTAESIRNGLQMARGEAVKRNAIVRFTLANDTSWTIGCVTVTVNCPATIQSKPAREGATASVTLAITGSNQARFTSLGTIDPSVAGQLTRVDIDNSSISATDSRDLRVTMGTVAIPSANPRVCDPNVVAVTDPRFCS